MSGIQHNVAATVLVEGPVELQTGHSQVEELDETCKNLYFAARRKGDSHAVAMKDLSKPGVKVHP